MKKMIINGTDVSQGRVVKALEAMLNGASDEELREFDCYKFDEQFYEIYSDAMPIYYMVKKEFNCLVVWMTHCGPTSFNGGMRLYRDSITHYVSLINSVMMNIRMYVGISLMV